MEELVEAQRMAQLHRLSCSETGRAILRSLRIPFASQHGIKCSWMTALRIPIPQNVPPDHHQDRRTSELLHFTGSCAGTHMSSIVGRCGLSRPTGCGRSRGRQARKRSDLGKILTTHPEVVEEAAIATRNSKHGSQNYCV
ncbi:hypothetical protein HPB48_014086 [Haemaphysalis longicornis]|uniref:Uncharacterized protein n=1 Tax=Haemaphysalis longicornis TaxID=44386 RepID=A0A9J6GBF5_HAELO|nr:hypothetical protein HPB48_014086 [Haemaphysalis longicornis]